MAIYRNVNNWQYWLPKIHFILGFLTSSSRWTHLSTRTIYRTWHTSTSRTV